MLANRVRKNARHLRKWARRDGVSCYRLYDKDIPEIALAIDWYEGRLHVAEYDSHRETETGWAQAMADSVAEALEVESSSVYLKTRRRQKGQSQYSRVGDAGERIVVHEAGHKFYVNLSDYLDTGLFLDHRPTRRRVEEESSGKQVLNLFSYTGAFTVYAACGGAAHTTSVDLSKTYCQWARDNLELNELSSETNEIVCGDAMTFLEERSGKRRFDLVIFDPPTFSNSKKMSTVLDIQRNHVELLNQVISMTRPGGVIYFSTNFRRFKLDAAALEGCDAKDISSATVPEDFRNKRIHSCFRLIVH